MGYHVKAVSSVACDPKRRSSTRTWKLQFIKMESGVRRIRDIPVDEYRSHGFLPSMTIEQAKSQKRASNERLKESADGLKKVQALKRVTDRERAQFKYLSEAEVREFEAEYLFRRLARGEYDYLKRSKIMSHWNVVKDLVCELKLDPSDWEREAFRFYNLFAEKRYSPAYVQKLLRILNAWGYFSAKKHGKAFLPLSRPRGMDRAFIANAFHAKRKENRKSGMLVGGASAPLSPQTLERAQSKLKPKHYNWLKISVWLGLRPKEIDSLIDKSNYRIEHDEKLGVPVIWVYMAKLVALEPDDRWKAIPCLYPAQRNVLAKIEKGKFKRPLTKTLHRYLGDEYFLYAGRKGFEDLMSQKGHGIEVIAEWLGHQSIEQTWRNYRNRKRVRV